jgi:hypothetical protein
LKFRFVEYSEAALEIATGMKHKRRIRHKTVHLHGEIIVVFVSGRPRSVRDLDREPLRDEERVRLVVDLDGEVDRPAARDARARARARVACARVLRHPPHAFACAEPMYAVSQSPHAGGGEKLTGACRACSAHAPPSLAASAQAPSGPRRRHTSLRSGPDPGGPGAARGAARAPSGTRRPRRAAAPRSAGRARARARGTHRTA